MKNKTLIIGILIALLVIIVSSIGGFIGNTNYEHDLSKCKNLKGGSYYGFTHDIQISADYSSDCYYLENHPFARYNKILGDVFLGLYLTLAVVIIVFVLHLLLKLLYEEFC